jgi:ABC-2 type transport system permease protein
MKDYWKSTLILVLLFSGMAAMYTSMFPVFEEMMIDMEQASTFDAFAFIPGYEDMATYIGFLNIEMYQIFWVLILGMILGFLAASAISKEIESKTIDLLLSNPISRTQIIVEKFIGLLPMLLIINFTTMLVIMGATIGIGEELNFYHLLLTHLISIPYFLSIIGIGFFISTLFDDKMKSSIITMALIVGMFILDSISEISSQYEVLGYLSLKHYFNPYEALKQGGIDSVGTGVLLCVVCLSLIASALYFNHKDITI